MTDIETPTRRLWVVGKVTDYPAKAWEFIGIFEDEAVAISTCRTNMYFVGPVQLNEALPDETVEWEGAFYPLHPVFSLNASMLRE